MKGTWWLARRQQRGLILALLILLVACAAWTVWQRAAMTGALPTTHPACKGWNGCDDPALRAVVERYTGPITALAIISTVFPALIGMFWGAPLLAREWENGTYRLTLSQEAGPLRLLAGRLGLAALCTAAGAAVLAALVAWWWAPIANTLTGPYWYDAAIFNGTGPASVTCALFGLAAGTLAGLLTRRTLPAMAATLAAVAVPRLILQAVRPLWIAPQLRTSPGMTPKQLIGSAWSSGHWGYLTPSGGRADIMNCPDSGAELLRCMNSHGYTGRFYQAYPSSDFWPLQTIEAGIYLVLALALTALVIRRLRPPTATPAPAHHDTPVAATAV
ncbi:transporter [Streptantibioticus silvisoli]|uniref:Transporter n=1 Tax=Streptantibioticus silvisoli TaxID=2705255 RepID=A0ABT6W984_9ACTN|nr:transporter [Streptantibioticus silvisoli]MDI5967321.1 transporter [Streptantibioticus silvisoli]